MVVFTLGKNLLFKSALGHCEALHQVLNFQNLRTIRTGSGNIKDKKIEIVFIIIRKLTKAIGILHTELLISKIVWLKSSLNSDKLIQTKLF